MDKSILYDYIDACELIKDTEAEIRKLQRKKRTTTETSVTGSNPDFPYNQQHFKVRGTIFTYPDDIRLREEERILENRKQHAENLKINVEEWLNEIPYRMQRIIRYKIFEELTWQQVAQKMGRKTSENSIKKEFERFMKEK